MRNYLIAGSLLCLGALNAQTADTTKVEPLEQSLQQMVDKTSAWALEMQAKFEDPVFTDEELEAFMDKFEIEAEKHEIRVEAFRDEFGPQFEIRAEQLARSMEEMAVRLSKQIEELAEEIAEEKSKTE